MILHGMAWHLLLLLFLLLLLQLLCHFPLLVPHLVLDEVVRADEAVATHGAPELLVASVGATVPRQLVRAGEAALARGHGASVWPLS